MFNPANTLRSLTRDERGGLLVIGILMGSLLVGGLWYLASVGDAILWREHAQDAADAAAFENAVWNARGMNTLVMLNMLMAAVMAVLVIWRLIIVFIAVVIAIIGIACGLGFLIPNPISTVACTLVRAIPQMTTTLARFKRLDDLISRNVIRITHALATAQKVVAGAIPAVGAMVTLKDTSEAFGTSAAWNFSASNLPNIESGIRLGVGKNPGYECDEEENKYSPRDFLQPRMGFGFSLPAQQDQWSVLCEKAAALLPNNIAGVLQRNGAPAELVASLDKLAAVLGPIAGSIPTLFCAPGPGSLQDAAKDIFNGVAKDRCNAEKKKKEDDGEDDFDFDKCMDDQAKKNGMGKVGERKPTCSKPMKVWDYAANGNIAMQSFSFIEQDAPMLTRDDEGLELGDRTATGNVSEVDPPWIRAQAEIYFDCDQAWEWCRGTAPWTLNWRARLRRIQRFEDMAARAGERLIVESLVQGANKMLGRAVKNAQSRRGIPDIISENTKDTWLTMQVRNQVRRVGYWTIAGRIRANPPSDTIVIH